jgi:hypothetical protein
VSMHVPIQRQEHGQTQSTHTHSVQSHTLSRPPLRNGGGVSRLIEREKTGGGGRGGDRGGGGEDRRSAGQARGKRRGGPQAYGGAQAYDLKRSLERHWRSEDEAIKCWSTGRCT